MGAPLDVIQGGSEDKECSPGASMGSVTGKVKERVVTENQTTTVESSGENDNGFTVTSQKGDVGDSWGNITSDDFMAVVKAYISRTFDEDLQLIEKLIGTSNCNDVLCASLKTSVDSGRCDSDALRQERVERFGVNVFGVRQQTCKTS